MTMHDVPAAALDIAVAREPDAIDRRDTVTDDRRRSTEPEPPALRAEGSRLRATAASVLWGVLGIAVAVAVWAVAAAQVPELPAPSETLTVMREMIADPFYDNGPNDKGVGILLWASLQRVGKGFLLATAVGVPVGLLIGADRRAWRAANPVIQLLRPVSPLAWFPIWLVAFKDSDQAAVWVIFITALWPTVINTAAGARGVPTDQRDVARVFRFGRIAYLRHVLVPNALPSIVTGMRLSMGIGWMVIVAVEMLSGSSGIGNATWQWYNGLDLPKVAAGIIFIGLLGLLLDLLFLRLARAVAIEEVSA
jgi:nitrate/nitrite transport system permease protein